MSYNLYDLDFELEDQNALGFSRKAILYERNDINKLVITGNEKLNHFSAKAITHYILSELNHNIVSECQRHPNFPQFRHMKIPHLYLYLTLRNLLRFWE